MSRMSRRGKAFTKTLVKRRLEKHKSNIVGPGGSYSTQAEKGSALKASPDEVWNRYWETQKGLQPEQKQQGGVYGRGNIDLNSRQTVKNPDGSFSTERSFSTNIDGKEVLLPTVVNGKNLTEDEAVEHYKKTGQHLGVFDTPEEADVYAENLHRLQGKYYAKGTPAGNPVMNNARETLLADSGYKTVTTTEPAMDRPYGNLSSNAQRYVDFIKNAINSGKGMKEVKAAQEQALGMYGFDVAMEAQPLVNDLILEFKGDKEPDTHNYRTLTRPFDEQSKLEQMADPNSELNRIYGKHQRDISAMQPGLYDKYEMTAAGDRGKFAYQALDLENYRKYVSQHPNNWANIDEEERYWTEEAKKARQAIEGVQNTSDELNDTWDPKYNNQTLEDLVTQLPELAVRPKDYGEKKEEYDRSLYDFMYGEPGWYDYDMQHDPEKVERELAEYWEPIDSGLAAEIADRLQKGGSLESDYEKNASLLRYAEKKLEDVKYRRGEKDKYDKLIGQYDDGEYSLPDLKYDKGTVYHRGLEDMEEGIRTNDPHRIFSLINGYTEYESWSEPWGEDGNPRVTGDYNYALMMTDGSNGTVNEKGIFNDLYIKAVEEGREPTEAKAFFEGLQYTLRSRYQEAQQIDTAEVTRNFPVLASGASLGMRTLNAFIDPVRHAAHLLGDESTEDPYSNWYKTALTADQIENTIAKDIGGVGGRYTRAS